MKKLDLVTLIDCLNDQQAPFSVHCQMLDQFMTYCQCITNVQADVTFDAFAPDTHLPSGMAINPQSAAQCVSDYHRTIGFIRAIYAGVEQLLNKQTSAVCLNLLYAGCGPYATLMLAVIAKFQNSNIHFHLLDIHQTALDSAQILLDHFYIPDEIYSFYCEDACEFVPNIKFDLIVAETMQKALEQEPQFQLTANLSQYVAPNGFFIPQSINLQLSLIFWKQELDESKRNKSKLLKTDTQQFERINIGEAVSLSKDSAQGWLAKKVEASINPYLDFGKFNTPAFNKQNNYDFAILTHIQLFETHYLEEYDSDLTLPTKLHDVSPAKSNAQYHLKYELGSYPRFELVSMG